MRKITSRGERGRRRRRGTRGERRRGERCSEEAAQQSN